MTDIAATIARMNVEDGDLEAFRASIPGIYPDPESRRIVNAFVDQMGEMVPAEELHKAENDAEETQRRLGNLQDAVEAMQTTLRSLLGTWPGDINPDTLRALCSLENDMIAALGKSLQ